MTKSPTAFEIIEAVHPHHVATIRAQQADMRPGAIVTVELERSLGGMIMTTMGGVVKEGEAAFISDFHLRGEHISRCLQSIDAGSHLVLNSGHLLTPVPMEGWTHDQAERSAVVATKARVALLNLAAQSCNPKRNTVDESRALEYLRSVNALDEFIGAAKVYADHIKGVTNEDGYYLSSYRRATRAA